MRIEILVDNGEPKIYPLDRPKIVVGSHESCDIVIDHTSISRKHLVIVGRDEKYFVADQGSMNGSYINEHRLVPGSSIEFTSCFPVRLGDNVLVTLLSDEDAGELGPDSDYNTPNSSGTPGTPVGNESTKMISLKDLHKSSTSDLVKQRTNTVAKRKNTLKKVERDSKKPLNSKVIILFVVIMFSGAAYFQLILNGKSEPEVTAATAKEKVAAPVPVIDKGPILRVEVSDLLPSESILAAYNNKKCVTEIEKFVCTSFPMIYQGKGGVVVVDKTIIIFVDGNKDMVAARDYVIKPLSIEEGGTKEAIDQFRLELGTSALMLWMKGTIPVEATNVDQTKGYIIAVAFIGSVDNVLAVVNAAYFVPDSFIRLRQMMKEENFINAKKNGASEFSFAYEYLRIP
jgi:pSer/pThr/pTyr-binding forkhead associated (FHA) protein